MTRFGFAAATAVLALGAAIASADSIEGTTTEGGVFNQPDAPAHAPLRSLIWNGLPTPAGAVFGGAFDFTITNLGAFSTDPATDGKTYAWTANFTLPLHTGSPENNAVTTSYSTTVLGTFAEVSGGWNHDAANGIWSNLSLYLLDSRPHGVFRFATDTLPGYWTGTGAGTLNGSFVNGDGQISYNAGFPNSAFILSGGDVSISAQAVPLPASAWAGLALCGLVAASRLRKRIPA